MALQDNQGKNMKRRSVQVPNFYKTFKDDSANEGGDG
jgi:hypothetical protein